MAAHKTLKTLLLKSLLFLTILGVTMSVIGFLADRGLQKSEDFWHKEWNEIRNGTAAVPVVVMGSSRAARDVSPGILADSLGVGVYNLGSDNLRMNDQILRYQYYREYNPPPRMVVHILDFFVLERRTGLYFPDQFLPYYKDSTIRKMVNEYEPMPLRANVPGVKYVGNGRKVGMGLAETMGIHHFTCEKVLGHAPLYLKWNDDFTDFQQRYPNGKWQKISEELARQWDEFLARCAREGTKVVLVYAPEYYPVQSIIHNRKMIFDVFNTLADKHHCTFIDYSADTIGLSTDNFCNSQHLNNVGVDKFSKDLAHRLKMEYSAP